MESALLGKKTTSDNCQLAMDCSKYHCGSVKCWKATVSFAQSQWSLFLTIELHAVNMWVGASLQYLTSADLPAGHYEATGVAMI